MFKCSFKYLNIYKIAVWKTLSAKSNISNVFILFLLTDTSTVYRKHFPTLHKHGDILWGPNVMTSTLLSLWIFLFSVKECWSLFWQVIKLVVAKLESLEACC